MAKRSPRLHFEEVERKAPSALRYAARDAPITAVTSQFHREMRDSDDNAATSAVDTSVSSIETTYHIGEAVQYAHKMKSYRHAEKANLNALQEQSGTTNPYSKYQQKKSIKQEYAKAKRTSSDTAKASEIASKAAQTAAEKTKQAVEFVRKNKKFFIILGIIAAVLLIFMNMISSCSVLLQGAVGSFGMTTYTATSENMQDVESMYTALEDDLRENMENYEDFTPGYDEYDITGEVLGHDPFVLASILSAVYGEYTPEDAEDLLELIFEMQYELTEEVLIIDDISVCIVTLTCTDMEEIAEILLTEEEYERYEVFMTTSGNLPELFDEP